ncbi:hypothetical protein A2765_06630 [Candidatus Kaiserbacteria bacterium RIFCSPHIGHO2_01_FULL_56_24]|uniref:Uncharacterized protein n=1 Tax=Candidatus Kaiserbacteria bacterium RIFCSPHIGHO2_01_FULL_56_24 TaxID=1798487 RepID=A0A1F6D945_9BACT|nr:MAG: hypothetical protein A2765_06630 [Candidatus Kaiserbacteria bacterium RIFCSPHIGHO2_01_FULL_56_24]
MKLGFVVAVFALASLGLFVSVAKADSVSVDFEAPTYVLGSINGQDGWGPAVNPAYDQEVDSSMGTLGFGAQSLRMSNAVTSGSFGDWVFSKSLGDEAGETLAQNGGMSGGVRQPHFEAEFDLASFMPLVHQPDLQVSVSPDRGDGARMSYLRFNDMPDGIHVIFADYQDGVVEPAGTCATGDNFVLTDIATLDRTVPHSIKFSMDFVDGQNNDVVEIYIDGFLMHAGTSWEGYFNYCELNPTRTVDSLLFQARTSAGTAPATDEEGFLFDNLSLMSGAKPVPPPGNGAINSSFIKIEASGGGKIINIDSSKASTGKNTAYGSRGGRGGSGGDVSAEAEVDNGGVKSDAEANGNNGAALAGDGGAGGNGSLGGLVNSGRATSRANSWNELNAADIELKVPNTINSTKLEVEVDNDACNCNLIDNKTRSRARTGKNDASGSNGGSGGSGGEIEAEAEAGDGDAEANGNNGGAVAGNGALGGTGAAGGEVNSGVADSMASTTNRGNITRIRITN